MNREDDEYNCDNDFVEYTEIVLAQNVQNEYVYPGLVNLSRILERLNQTLVWGTH